MLFDHCFHYGLSSRAQTVVAIVSKRGAPVAVAPRLKATRKVFLGYDRIDCKNDTHQNLNLTAMVASPMLHKKWMRTTVLY